MPKITVNEVDNTLRTFGIDIQNVVYIPGFSVGGTIGVDEPTLCTTTSQFIKYFGKTPVSFGLDQRYISKWDSKAIPNSKIMFKSGVTDRAYLMAYELITNGIPVIYERMNEQEDTSIEQTNCGTGKATLENFGVYMKTLGTETETKYFPEVVGAYGVFVNAEVADEGNEDTIYTPHLYVCTTLEPEINPTKCVWTEITDVTTFEVSANTNTPEKLTIYNANVHHLLEKLKDRMIYSDENVLYDKNYAQIKFVTSGGYPTFEYDDNSVVDAMVNFVNERGDCTALIDHSNNPNRVLTASDETSVMSAVQGLDGSSNLSHAAMYTPWFMYGSEEMSGCFAYLITFANAVKTNPNWLAIAGVKRGVVPNAQSLIADQKMTRAIADSYTAKDEENPNRKLINPIVAIKPYGYTIWGNRTLMPTVANTEQALYFMNLRSLTDEIKRKAYTVSEQLMFEQNSDILWINFEIGMKSLLDKMKAGNGISGYTIEKVESEERSKLVASITVYPLFAVEEFDITVTLTDEETTVEESEE